MQRRLGSGLIVVGDLRAAREPQSLGCTVCQATFAASERVVWERHVVRCAAEHEDELRAMSPRAKAPGIFGEGEVERWAREHRDELREGRKRL